MKKSTVERRYTKKALADMLKVDPTSFTKDTLVEMALPIFNEAENVPEVDGDVIDQTKPKTGTEENDSDLDNAIDIVLKEGILYRIDSHCWWGKTSRVPEEELDIPKEVMGGVKTLIDPKHLGPFRQWKGIGERIVKKVGYQFLGLRGVYFVPKGFIKLAEEKLLECQEMADKEGNNFVENFDFYKQEWKTTVVDLCVEKGIDEKIALAYLNDSYYPSKSQLKDRFVFRWTKFAITVPGSDMGILTDEQYRDEVRKQKEQAREFLDNCIAELAAKFYEIISKMNEKLKKGEQIRPKTLESLNNFTEIFDRMNITKNEQLAGFVNEARKMFSGVSVSDFKEDKFAKKIKTGLSKVVTSFNEESDAKLLRDIEF